MCKYAILLARCPQSSCTKIFLFTAFYTYYYWVRLLFYILLALKENPQKYKRKKAIVKLTDSPQLVPGRLEAGS